MSNCGSCEVALDQESGRIEACQAYCASLGLRCVPDPAYLNYQCVTQVQGSCATAPTCQGQIVDNLLCPCGP